MNSEEKERKEVVEWKKLKEGKGWAKDKKGRKRGKERDCEGRDARKKEREEVEVKRML